MDEKIVHVPFDKLEKFIADVLKSVGLPEDDAKICSDVLISADKQGIDSHGIARLKTIYYDRIKQGTQLPVTKIDLVKESPTTAVFDANNGMGQVASEKAMEKAITKAKKYGIGMTVVRNSNHYGIAGYYCNMAVKAGMIGISGTNARPSVAPTFGVENMLGTNPLSFGMPSDEAFPFMLDCATSLSQRGKVEMYDRIGKKLPEGWIIGEDGKTRTDTHQILADLLKGPAAFTPLGGIGDETAGYKGYGYGTVVEILSAALAQGAFMKGLLGLENGKKVPYRLGHFFMAVDISVFTELNKFKKTTGDILRALRASKKMPGKDRIYTAGEKEYIVWQERKTKGVPINEAVMKEMLTMKEECGLKQHSF
jgi:LDH2 family malate/lactate/ureidoglycolate dehydrogenase